MITKAVIFRPDHRTEVVYLRRRRIGNDKTFRHNDTVYKIDDQHFMLTRYHPKLRLGLPAWAVTYYYRQGSPEPLPVPEFPAYANLGVDGAVLASLFNPWLLRILAPSSRTKTERLFLLLLGGTLAGVAYLVYALVTGSYVLPGSG